MTARRKRVPPMTVEEIDDMVDDAMPHGAYVELRELENRIRAMSPAERRDHCREVWNGMIENGSLVEYPPNSKRYVLQSMIDLITEGEDEWTKAHRPSEYNPNNIRVLK